MKHLQFLLVFPLIASAQFKQQFVTDDLKHFNNAAKQILLTSDSLQQKSLLEKLYLTPGTEGLQSLVLVRNYSEKELRKAIVDHPKFWKSVRGDLKIHKTKLDQIERNISKLKSAYPKLRHLPIYFAVGAFRTPGTVFEGKVLIGGELSLIRPGADVSEFPKWRQDYYKEFSPRKNLALLCTHEYIHGQQKPLVQNLLSMCLYEGIAEFISCHVTGMPSNTPAVAFGKMNSERVIDKFADELFMLKQSDWIWGENTNEFKIRDLGYYIGYEIAERHYNNSTEKIAAVRELIELDYTDENAVEKLVDNTKVLPKRLSELYEEYEKRRPLIIRTQPFTNGSKSVKNGTVDFTFEFSEPLTGYHSGIDFGPLGATNFPKIIKRVWSADKKSMTITMELEPKMRYQFLIDNTFRNDDGVRLKPHLVEFTTE